MPLVPMSRLLTHAKANRYGIAAFNFVDYASLLATVKAAEELKAPVITQVSVKTVKLWGHRPIVAWARAIAAETTVPFALHVDHCSDLKFVQQCIDAGWTSVMYDGSVLPFEDNLANTLKVVAMAQSKGISVEAELGTIGGVEDDLHVNDDQARLADPDKAIEFCRRVKLDCFAPAVGTAHGIYKGEPKIAYDRLEKIIAATGVPGALHGGTGLADEVFLRCIALGCAKLNISTLIKYAFIDGFCDYHQANPEDYEPVKVITAQLARMQAEMKKYIQLFGASGKATAIGA